MEFIRFAGTINTHEEKKVAKATVNVILENCTGTFYITDIMFQEGKWLTGYVVNNLELLQKKRVDGEITPVRFFNGIVRSGVTAVRSISRAELSHHSKRYDGSRRHECGS